MVTSATLDRNGGVVEVLPDELKFGQPLAEIPQLAPIPLDGPLDRSAIFDHLQPPAPCWVILACQPPQV